MRILLITNDRHLAKRMETFLAEHVLSFRDVSQQEAQHLLENGGENDFNCLLLDDQLSDPDVIQMCANLSERKALRDLPKLVLISNDRDVSYIKKLFTAGAFDFITKPFDEMEVIGRIHAASSIRREITKRQKNEREMGELLEQFRLNISALKVAAHAIIITDKMGRISWVNPAFTTLTGYAEHEAVGKNMHILKSGIHDVQFYEDLWSTILSGQVWSGEITNRRKDGTIYHEDTSITPVTSKNGEITHFVSVKQDITERKNMAKKLEEELRVAKQVQQSALSPPLHDEYIDLSALYLPSTELAGDMYSWFKIDEHRYGIFVFDVMGHGVSSSLVSMSVRSVMRGFITKSVEPISVISELNQHLLQLFQYNRYYTNHYLTAIYIEINVAEKTGQYINSGHPPAFLICDDGEIQQLSKGSMPVGLFEEFPIVKGEFSYEENIRLLVYTDGLIEALSKDFDVGMKQLSDFYNSCRSLSSNETIGKMHQHIQDSVVKQSDDICVVHLKTK
ncbi:SpoIIE family protein phosphatase [Bacillus tianshenii]|nr:SpoIIE family protein phosphatase [Bacillus tianshenii]